MPSRGEPAYIEIVERKQQYDVASRNGAEHLIRPNEVRINGCPLLIPQGETVQVHDLSLSDSDCVQVTLTLWAKRVVVQSEEVTDEPEHAAMDGEPPFRDQTAGDLGLCGNPR